MPNQPRTNNPHRSVRVEDDLWAAAEAAAVIEGTTRGDVMRDALRALVERNTNPLHFVTL
jgi:DNA-binding transcriptional regulator YdaS (Cro superfamily)